MVMKNPNGNRDRKGKKNGNRKKKSDLITLIEDLSEKKEKETPEEMMARLVKNLSASALLQDSLLGPSTTDLAIHMKEEMEIALYGRSFLRATRDMERMSQTMSNPNYRPTEALTPLPSQEEPTAVVGFDEDALEEMDSEEEDALDEMDSEEEDVVSRPASTAPGDVVATSDSPEEERPSEEDQSAPPKSGYMFQFQ